MSEIKALMKSTSLTPLIDSIIGQYTETSLILAGFNQSSVKEVSVNRIELNGVDIKGFIFNAVEKKTSSYYGDYNYEYKTKG